MALERQILTRTEPTIALDDLQFQSQGEEEGKANISKDLGGRTPLIHINGYVFGEADVKTMVLDMNGVIPKITVTIIDTQGYFIVDNYPRSGDVLSLRIASRQTDTYKDIRIDFDIEKVQSVPKAAKEQSESGSKYTFSGVMKIPGLFAEKCKVYEEGNSLDHLEALATDIGLGFASNIDAADPDDLMKLVIPSRTMSEVIKETVQHSYVGDASFQTYSIDPYYYLTYVDVNKAINAEDGVDISFANFAERYDEYTGEEDDKMTAALVLTTLTASEGTNNHISKYALKYGSGKVARTNGYKRVLQMYEDNPMHDNGGLGMVNLDIEPISSDELSDIEEPLKGRRGEERYLDEIKYKYIGRSSNSFSGNNTHPNWKFAELHNKQNMLELDKLKLEVELPVFNPAIYRYQKLPVVILTEGLNQKLSSDQVENKKSDEGFDNTGNTEGKEEATGEQKLNTFLTGYYIVGGIQYIYNAKDGAIKQKLTLLRREWESRSNNLDGALLDSKPVDTSTPEPVPENPPAEEPPAEEPPAEEPAAEEPPVEEEEPETVITVTPTTPLNFSVKEDEDSDARLINVKASGLGIFALTVSMPGGDIYFDFKLPGYDKNWGNRDWHFSASDFPDLPEGEIDIDIEVYVEEAMDDGSIGNIEVSAGDAPTVRIPVNVTFIT